MKQFKIIWKYVSPFHEIPWAESVVNASNKSEAVDLLCDWLNLRRECLTIISITVK